MAQNRCPARRCRYRSCVSYSICNKREALIGWFAAVSNADLLTSGKFKTRFIMIR